MNRRSNVLIAVFALAALAGLVAALVWLGQPLGGMVGAPQEAPAITFEGVIRQAGTVPGTWVVDRFPVAVVDSTRIITNGLSAEVGTWARVEAVKVDTGLEATTVELQPEPGSALFDAIRALDGQAGLWQVGNTQVLLKDGTQVTGEPQVGRLALVYGERGLEGLVATRIVVLSSDDAVFVEGEVVSLGASMWQVDNLEVLIDEDTVIAGTPQVGGRVQIMGRQLGPDEVQALEIRVLDGGEGQPLLAWLIRIDGPPHASLWRVNHSDGPNLSPIFVAVNEETIIDETLGPAVPEAWLEIEATSQSPDFYTAQRITVLARAPKRQIVGEVQAMPDEGPYGRWEIDDYQVEVDSGTGIVGMPEMGSWVWVTGAPDLENVIYAEAIQVLGP